jgi:hypothetical protein
LSRQCSLSSPIKHRRDAEDQVVGVRRCVCLALQAASTGISAAADREKVLDAAVRIIAGRWR